jgi:hypothetical protein
MDSGSLGSPIVLAELCALLAVASGIIAFFGLESGRRGSDDHALPMRAASWRDAPPPARGLKL